MMTLDYNRMIVLDCNGNDRFLYGYRAGYLKALLDLRNCLTSREQAFKSHKVLPARSNQTVCKLVSAILRNLDAWMEVGGELEVIHDPKNGEFFIKKQR